MSKDYLDAALTNLDTHTEAYKDLRRLVNKTVAVDLDGVLAQYDGWQGGNHICPPNPGAQAFIQGLIDRGMIPVIYTARGQLSPVKNWLRNWGFPKHIKVKTKMPAAIYIDDRAFHFSINNPNHSFNAAMEAAIKLCEEAK